MRNDLLPQMAPVLALEAPDLSAQMVREGGRAQRRHRIIRYVSRIPTREDALEFGLVKDLSCAVKAITVVSVLRGVAWAARTVAVGKDSEMSWAIVAEEGLKGALAEFMGGIPLVAMYVGMRSWGRWRES